jgi:hypothetical protein
MVAFEAGELQGRLNDMGLEAIAEDEEEEVMLTKEEKKENGIEELEGNNPWEDANEPALMIVGVRTYSL